MFKKKLPFIIILFFIIKITFAQTGKIKVDYTLRKKYITNSETLIVNKNLAVYVTDSLLITNENRIVDYDETTNTTSLISKTIKLDKTKYYLNQNSNILFYSLFFKNETVLVKDLLPEFNWNLINDETKKINGFVCNKATINFRGSQMIAWYTKEIPIPFGPWKFKGLPGLILEIYNVNDSNITHWVANKIVFPYSTEIDFNINKSIKQVPLKEVMLYIEDMMKAQFKMTNSRVPKGVTAVKSKFSRAGIEKIYEWEEKTKED